VSGRWVEEGDDYYYEEGDDYEYLETEEGYHYREVDEDGTEYAESERYGGGGGCFFVALTLLGGSAVALHALRSGGIATAARLW